MVVLNAERVILSTVQQLTWYSSCALNLHLLIFVNLLTAYRVWDVQTMSGLAVFLFNKDLARKNGTLKLTTKSEMTVGTGY